MLFRRRLPWLLISLLVVTSSSGALAAGNGPGGPASPAGTGFTYQGQLTSGSGLVSATCAFQFSLWDSAGSGNPPIGGVQLGTYQNLTGVSVVSGAFTVVLNDTGQFGASAFTGQARWLAVGVQCPPDSGFTTLTPRQPLTAAPYALYALSGGTTYTAGAGLMLTGTTFALDPSYTDGRYWKLSGNAGTTANNFLGTTDNMTLTLAVSGTAALRLVPNGADGPDVIGGTSGNSITGVNTGGVTIFGGGPGLVNTVQGTNISYATISGGVQNTISGTVYHGTIGGGYNNTIAGPTVLALASDSTIGGGIGNNLSGWMGTIAGGQSNVVTGTAGFVGGGSGNHASNQYSAIGGGSGNHASNDYAAIGGGSINTASNQYATIGGGYHGTASGYAAVVGGGNTNTASGDHASVGGGYFNTASSQYGTVPGGRSNTAGGLPYATVSGGYGNTASGAGATVGGGGWDGSSNAGNTAAGGASTIAGGFGNAATNNFATVAGGAGNTASNQYATVPGGAHNTASGFGSFAAGEQASAVNDGAFVWSDGSGIPITSTVNNQFLVRATGGFSLTTSSDGTVGCALPPGGGSWICTSDRNAKANFAPVDGLQVLNTLAGIPIQTWNFKTQAAAIRHMGPMAQDFHAAFGVGENDTTISTVDAQGVALAAIQGLYTVVQQKDAQLAQQQAEITALQATVTTLQAGQAEVNARLAVVNSGPALAPSAQASGAPAPGANTLQLLVVLLVGLVAGGGLCLGAFAFGRRGVPVNAATGAGEQR